MREELSPLTPREACKVATPQEVVSKPTIPKEASKAATPRDATDVQGGLPEPPEVSKPLASPATRSLPSAPAIYSSSPVS
ncbi:uncharacterized protein B0H18DRAFT_1124198 [Fomitopsis serialis]|uniref:uncharacterized protein n=1 Tax=Fomitopsis serialis TaxID=139415 RepID=UPI002008106E|nr:uncharacterized protein B0H18DRAFT_1124198 [Neoantrodia serialis]KAH9916467.1 hypothetical protein B0H18DRAFT_1124198 [Neoantrodia serialis]